MELQLEVEVGVGQEEGVRLAAYHQEEDLTQEVPDSTISRSGTIQSQNHPMRQFGTNLCLLS